MSLAQLQSSTLESMIKACSQQNNGIGTELKDKVLAIVMYCKHIPSTQRKHYCICLNIPLHFVSLHGSVEHTGPHCVHLTGQDA